MIRHVAACALALMAGTFGALPAAAVTVRFPANVADYYPARAMNNLVEGAAKAICVLLENGKLSACRVGSENPTGYGFGEAAVKIARRSQVDIAASGLTGSIGKEVVVPVEFRLIGEEPLPPPPTDNVTASDDGETPQPPEGEYEDHADGQQFADDVELTAEDRAARQVHSTTPAETGCPEKSGCLAAN